MSFKRKLVITLVIIVGGIRILTILMPQKEEEHQKKSTQTEVVITGGNLDVLKPIDEDAIEDSEYRNTIEEALKYQGDNSNPENAYMYNVDEVLFQLESDKYSTIYYRSVKSKTEECYTMAKLKKKLIDGNIKYVFLSCNYSEMEDNAWIVGSFESIVESKLKLLDVARDLGPNPEKRFVYGDTKDEKIFKLKIEGQEPTGIIPYESFDEQWYFWYYEDLKSDKPGSQLEFTVE